MARFMAQFLTRFWFVISMVLLVTITCLSLFPQDELPTVAGTDKLHHFIAYAALAVPVAFARPKYWFAMIVFYFCFSGAIELIQPYVNRYGDWFDLMANTGGLSTGVVLAFIARFVLSLIQKETQGKSVSQP